MTTNHKGPIYQMVDDKINKLHDSARLLKVSSPLVTATLFFEILNEIKNEIQELEPVWIPVAEHEGDEEVIVTGLGGWRTIAIELDGCWFESTENPDEEIFPTHFMPLPQSPK